MGEQGATGGQEGKRLEGSFGTGLEKGKVWTGQGGGMGRRERVNDGWVGRKRSLDLKSEHPRASQRYRAKVRAGCGLSPAGHPQAAPSWCWVLGASWAPASSPTSQTPTGAGPERSFSSWLRWPRPNVISRFEDVPDGRVGDSCVPETQPNSGLPEPAKTVAEVGPAGGLCPSWRVGVAGF